MLTQSKHQMTSKDEIWYCDTSMVVVYQPNNHSLHFLDKENMEKLLPSSHCENRQHASDIFTLRISNQN